MAISRTFSLQEDGPARIRFMPEALLLTAACLWLINSLHARPEDGPASRDLMRAILPITEESDVIRDVLAYNTSVRPAWQEEEEEEDDPYERPPGVPYNPYGIVFFRTIMLQTDKVDVPRFYCGGPSITPPSFKFFFDGMTQADVESKYKTVGFVARETIANMRPTNKKSGLSYVNTTGAPQPDLFDLDTQGYSLAPAARDEGSDLEEPSSPDDRDAGIDAQMSRLWRQFVMDISYKAPNQRGVSNPSHVRLSREDRLAASEEPYRNINLAQVFHAVWYKNAEVDQWKQAFNWLFPPIGRRVAKDVQNYGACKYYSMWMELLDDNRDNKRLIEAIRAKFFKRIREWRWMPYAQSDRIWSTSAKKPSSRSFTRWPPAADRPPAPHILLHSREIPSFHVAEEERHNEGV
jgi:hypothetical protein